MTKKHLNQLTSAIAAVAAVLALTFMPSCDFDPYKDDPQDNKEEKIPPRDTSVTYSVTKAQTLLGQQGVWVYGYVVGCISPFKGSTFSATNLAIAADTSAATKAECMSVELKKGPIRDSLNLEQHPSYIGRKLYLKGDIVKYYSAPGVKNITDWFWN